MDIDVIYNKNCIEVLKRLGDNSIDAIVTDPPYNLGFMGKKWDRTGIAFNSELWEECLRVIKPGGNLLSFGGARTYHRMVCAIEDAGFEIRDCIIWCYGSGFPKSLNIGKAVDKLQGNKRKVVGVNPCVRPNSDGKQQGYSGIQTHSKQITKGTSEWEGYGTGLKPAYEPIALAMKPLDGTFAENCLKWGVGGLNIDATRIPTNETIKVCGDKKHLQQWKEQDGRTIRNKDEIINTPYEHTRGRFPANLILDGSQEVMELFPNPHGAGYKIETGKWGNKSKGMFPLQSGARFGDKGSATRFFYCAKASKKERGEGNLHPTIKPLALMEYLVKLVTRPNHIVLDPFIGSGTTAMACVKLGRHYIGCELDKGYYDIAIKRVDF